VTLALRAEVPRLSSRAKVNRQKRTGQRSIGHAAQATEVAQGIRAERRIVRADDGHTTTAT